MNFPIHYYDLTNLTKFQQLIYIQSYKDSHDIMVYKQVIGQQRYMKLNFREFFTNRAGQRLHFIGQARQL